MRYVAIFVLFCTSFIFIFGFISFKKFTNPFVSAFSETSVIDVREQDIFSIVFYKVNSLEENTVVVESANYIIIDNEKNKVINYEIPTSYEFDVPGKYSYEPLSKIMSFGSAMENNDTGAGINLANKALSNFFAFSSDKYIVVERDIASDISEFLFEGNPTIMLDFSLINKFEDSLRTNLSAKEMYHVYKQYGLAKSEDVINRKINDSYVADQSTLDAEISDITFDSHVAREKKSIAILNGADHVGLANYSSRVISNMGGRVLAVGNATEPYAESMLIVDDPNSHTVRDMLNFFEIQKVYAKEDVVQITESEVNRADIVLILGLDIVESL